MISSSYLMLIVATLVIGMGAQWYVNHKLKTYSHVANSTGLTGAEAARQMLSYYGISNVQVFRGGPGQDYFDPRSNSVTLSPEAFDGRTITATATACHEVGHACQYAQDYTPMKIRGAIVAGGEPGLERLDLSAHGRHRLKHRRAYHGGHHHVRRGGALPGHGHAARRVQRLPARHGLHGPDWPARQERKGAFDVLRACAFTYLAAALTSILQLLWLLGQRQE